VTNGQDPIGVAFDVAGELVKLDAGTSVQPRGE
jgi:hypothetical protein